MFRAAHHRKEESLFDRALQQVTPPRLELKSRAGDEIADGAGHEHLRRRGERGDAGGNVNRDPSKVVAANLALTGVNTDSNLDADVVQAFSHSPAKSNGPARPVERSEEPIAGRVHLSSTKPCELPANLAIVSIQHRPLAAVSELSRSAGRVDDVGEHQGREDPIDVA